MGGMPSYLSAALVSMACTGPCVALPGEHRAPTSVELSPVDYDLSRCALPARLSQSVRVTYADPGTNLLRGTVRLDTTLVRNAAAGAITWRAGDFVSSPYGAWAAPVRLGGLQWQGRTDGIDYSLATGYLRRGYAVESNAYDGHPAALASVRAGLTDWLTVQGHTESVEQLTAGGLGVTAHLGGLGLLTGSAARSAEPGREGSQWTQSWQVSRAGIGVRAARTASAGRFRALASLQTGAVAARHGTELTMTGPVVGGDLSVGYTRVQAPAGSVDAPPGTTSVGTLGYSTKLRRRWSLKTSASHDFVQSAAGGAIEVSRPFGWSS